MRRSFLKVFCLALIACILILACASSDVSGFLDFKSEISGFVQESGIAKAVGAAQSILTKSATSGIAVINRFKSPLEVKLDEEMKAVAGELSKLAQAMIYITGPQIKAAYDKIRSALASIPDAEIGWSFPGGRFEAFKRGGSLAVMGIMRASGSRLIVGISNSDPLCDYAGGRLSNPTPGLPYAFIDITGGLYSSFQARMPLVGGLPLIRASSSMEIGGQLFSIDLSAFDFVPTKVECEIGLGIEATFDAELMLEGELEGKLCYECEPHKATAFARQAMEAMQRSAPIKPGMEVDARTAANMLYAGFRQVLSSITASGDTLGEVGIQVELTAKAGVGAADTSATAGSLKAGIGFMLPVGDAAKLTVAVIGDVLQAGMDSLPYIQRYATYRSFNDPEAIGRDAAELERILANLARSGLSKALAASSNSKAKLEVALDALGEGKSDSATSLRMFGIEAEIPAGRSIQSIFRTDFVNECINAIVYIIDRISPKGISGRRAAQEPDWNRLLSAVPAGTLLELELSPGIPLMTLEAKFPLSSMAETIKAGGSSVIELLASLPECVRSGNFTPLMKKAAGSFASLTSKAVTEFKKDSTFTLKLGGGFDVSLGAEAAAEIGIGAKAFIKTDLELPCVLAGSKYDSAGKDGEASVGLLFEFEGEGKVEPGEFVEVEASAGVDTKHKLFNVTFREVDSKPTSPVEVIVAGFLVTSYKGSVAQDGSLSGSGKLHLPIGGTVDASFKTDKAGKVLSGSWKGTVRIAERTFSIASGSLKDDGLHWSANPGLPFMPASASIDMRLGPDFELSGQGTATASLLGVSQQYAVGIDLSTGQFYGSAKQSVRIGPWAFANADFRLDNSGITGSGDLVMPGGTTTRWDISVSSDGTISGSYAKDFKIAGWSLARTQLAIGNTKITGTGYIKLPGTATEMQYGITITSDLKLSASWAGSVGYGSWTLAEAAVTVTDGSFSGSAKAGIPGNSSIAFGLSGTPTSFTATAAQSLTLLGYNLTNASLSLSTTKISGSASVSLPSGPSVSLAFNITPTSFSGTVTQDLTIMGWTFTTMKLTMTDTSFTGAGKVDLPGGSKAAANLTFTPTTVTGSASLSSGKLLSWTSTSISVSFSNNSLVGTASLKLGTTPSFTQSFNVTITPTGISGSATVAGPTLMGWTLATGSLTLNGLAVTGTLDITVPGIAKTSYLVDASPTKLDITYAGSITVMGYDVTNADLRIAGSTMTGSFKLAVPGLTSTQFTVAASTTKFEATATGQITVCSWDAAEASLKLANSAITGTGKIDILGVKPNFDFTVTPTGASGKYEQNMDFPLPGGKKVTIENCKLTLDTANGMRGTGRLKLANVTLANADFGIAKSGSITGIAYLGLGANNVKCNFTLTSSSISLTGSMSASASCTVPVPLISDPTFSLSATVSVGIQNTNELKLTASGTVDAPVIDPKSVSGSVDLATGKFSVSVVGYNLEFDLF